MQSFKKHLAEKLKASDDMGTWIKDFQDSDAPQFKGKSKEKKRQMAIAAKLDAERNESVELEEKYTATSEKSKFGKGGYRPHLKNPEGKTSYMAGVSYKTHDHAAGEAAAYHKGYTSGPGKANERGAERAVAVYRAKHKQHMHEEVEQLDELSPNTLHRYIKKATGNLAGNSAANAAVAAVQVDKPKSQKANRKDLVRNIRNRMKGITSASGRLADKANQNESVELDEQTQYDLVEAYLLENNIDADALSVEQLDEIIGKVVGGAFKLGAKAAVRGAKAAGKVVNRMTTAGRADAAEKKAAALEKKNKDRERIKAAQERLRKARDAARNK